jgi:hypothetical protein
VPSCSVLSSVIDLFGLLFGLLFAITVILMALIKIMINGIPKIVPIFIGAILGGYLFSRFVLIFPAVAIDLRPSLEWAWKQSKKNGWRIFILFAIPFMPSYGIYFLFPGEKSFLFNGLSMIINFPLFVIGIVFISLSYKELCMKDYDID